MKLRDFDSPFVAMNEARKAGYWPRHRRDGLNVWLNDKGQELVLKRERRPRSTVWHWVKEVPADKAAVLL